MVITGVRSSCKSAAINEQSWNTGGLPQWPAKGFIMVAFPCCSSRGFRSSIKRIAVMRGLIADPHEGQKNSLETEANEVIGAMAKPEDATDVR